MATLFTIIGRKASRIEPLAVRFIGGQRCDYHRHPSALFYAAAIKQFHLSRKLILPTPVSSVRHYSSSPKRRNSDESLVKVIESEIICAEESDGVEEAPEGFPFKIEDNPGQQTISLSREYPGETINVEVHMPDLITGEEDDENDNDDVNEKSNHSSISLVVRVTKSNGPILEFGCTAYPDEISIDSLFVKEPESSEDQFAYGPDFSDLDENLQKAFQKYLEIRGIKPSTTNFLHEYMINKDSKEYLVWLKNLKKFVQA